LDCDKRLSLSVLTPALLLDFLDWLERGRGRPVSVATRNQRLAALRSFFTFLELYCDQIDSSLWQRLRKLPFKRTRKERVDYLESNEMGHLLNLVPRNCADGSRDFLLLTLLYNTGARASEVALLQKSDLMLAEPSSSQKVWQMKIATILFD
jgi:integrase